MNGVPLDLVDWVPDQLPYAPRPVAGELLSSWALRLAGANELTLRQFCAAIGLRSNHIRHDRIFDYDSPPAWRQALAAFARVPERSVWALDLRQQFPAAGRAWFLHDPGWSDTVATSFCPACFAEQLRTRTPLHLKAEWAVACVTRCLQHEFPLQRFCPACGERAPVQFCRPPAVECYRCRFNLVTTPKPTPEHEPAISTIARLILSLLAGAPAEPSWIGPVTAAEFRVVIEDLIWVFTTPELRESRDARTLVDDIAFYHCRSRQPYNQCPGIPFFARPWKQREAVVCAIAQVLFGPRSAEAFHIRRLSDHLELYPFVEILRTVKQNTAPLIAVSRRWPASLQSRLQQAQGCVGGLRPKKNRSRRLQNPDGAQEQPGPNPLGPPLRSSTD